MVEELGDDFGKTTFDWLVIAGRRAIEPIEVVRSRFSLKLDRVVLGTGALDLASVPTGVMPIIEPKADRPDFSTRNGSG